MSERAWKRTERAIAARLGGVRVPVSGRQRGDAPDIAHPTFAVEVKSRASLPTCTARWRKRSPRSDSGNCRS